MIIDFINGNGGGGGGTTDTTMRASGFTGVDFENNVLSFNNLGGNEVGSVSLSGLTPDLSDYYTKSEIDAIESADTQSINTLQTAVSGNTDAISGLDTRVSANTEAIAEISGHTGGDATELQPKTAIPESGAAGTVIAINKPDEAGWTSYVAGSGKSRTQISYYVEPSDNPNPDLSLRPTRYEITVAYADSVDENGNYTYSNQTTVELSVDYQGNITFTNLGNFSQDGDGYSLVADIYDYATGENIQKTLYMSLENGYLYFNNGQGDCPYDMSWTQYQYYWQDMGSWDESDPENPVWQESWSEMPNGVAFQSWGIASPAKIGIYQANSANTYVDYASQIPVPTEVEKAQRLKTYPNGTDFDSITFEGGDVISVVDWGRPAYINSTSTGLNDARQIAFSDEVENLRNQMKQVDTTKILDGFEYCPKDEIGTAYAVKDGGIKQVVSGATTSGWISHKNTWAHFQKGNVLKVKYPSDMNAHMEVSVAFNDTDAAMRLTNFTDFTINWDYFGWTYVSETSDTYVCERDYNGTTVQMTAMNDGTNITVTFSEPMDYGFDAWDERNLQYTLYYYVSDKLPEVSYVSSEQGLGKIWKGTQQEYDAITTKDSSTIYIII